MLLLAAVQNWSGSVLFWACVIVGITILFALLKGMLKFVIFLVVLGLIAYLLYLVGPFSMFSS